MGIRRDDKADEVNLSKSRKAMDCRFGRTWSGAREGHRKRTVRRRGNAFGRAVVVGLVAASMAIAATDISLADKQGQSSPDFEDAENTGQTGDSQACSPVGGAESLPVGTRPVIVESPVYELMADGELEHAVIVAYPSHQDALMKSNGEFLLVDLRSGAARRPTSLLSEYWGLAPAFNPLGHTVVQMHRPSLLKPIQRLRAAGLSGLLDTTPWIDEMAGLFYDADENSLVRFPKDGTPDPLCFSLGWIPGSEFLIVHSDRMPTGTEWLMIVDGEGDIVSRFQIKQTPELGALGFFEVERETYVSLGAQARKIPSVTFTPWNEGKRDTIDAPEGQMIVGWSPDARYALLAPVRTDLLFPLSPSVGSCLPGRLTTHVFSRLLFERSIGGSPSNATGPSAQCGRMAAPVLLTISSQDKMGASNDPVQITLWDRVTNERVRFLTLPIGGYSEAPGGYLYLGMDVRLYITTNEILVETTDPSMGWDTTLRRYCLVDRQWRDITVPEGFTFLQGCLISVRYKREMALVRVGEKACELNQRPFAAPGRPLVRQLAVVWLKSGEIRCVPFDGTASTCELMSDGRVLAIVGGALVRYDVRKDVKETIIQDLCSTMTPRE